MTIIVTPIYAVLLTVILVVLSFRVIRARQTEKFAYGDNDSPRNQAKIRAQANWAEYVPITLLLMLMAEVNGVTPWLLHLTGLPLLIGRALHGYGMSFNPKWFQGRVKGMQLTFAAIVLAIVSVLVSLF